MFTIKAKTPKSKNKAKTMAWIWWYRNLIPISSSNCQIYANFEFEKLTELLLFFSFVFFASVFRPWLIFDVSLCFWSRFYVSSMLHHHIQIPINWYFALFHSPLKFHVFRIISKRITSTSPSQLSHP